MTVYVHYIDRRDGWVVEYDENDMTKSESFQTEVLARSFLTSVVKDPGVSKIVLYSPSGEVKFSKDAKWAGSYSAMVRGKQVSVEATVEAPDAYAAGDKLRELFEKKYGSNFSYPVVRFKSGSKRLDPSSQSLAVALRAGPEEV